MITYSCDEQLSFAEYREFLTRTDLGAQYPKHDFEARVRKLLANLDIAITARSSEGLLVGIAFGLTDFAYFLFITDLGVDHRFIRQGIGRELLDRLVEAAGGPDDITVTTISNDDAVEFYRCCGLTNEVNLVVRYCRNWEDLVVD